jgi:4-hydroxybutyryl-CoA dehydratase/vinylacetyl-CoA-Delta-isomerase
VARFIEDLTASSAGCIRDSLHGGGSPAMKMEIWRNYPLGNKVDLRAVADRGVLTDETRRITRNRQPDVDATDACARCHKGTAAADRSPSKTWTVQRRLLRTRA